MWTRVAELLAYYAVGPSPAPLWPQASAQAAAKMLTGIHVSGPARARAPGVHVCVRGGG
jgi:hypothetical protein